MEALDQNQTDVWASNENVFRSHAIPLQYWTVAHVHIVGDKLGGQGMRPPSMTKRGIESRPPAMAELSRAPAADEGECQPRHDDPLLFPPSWRKKTTAVAHPFT